MYGAEDDYVFPSIKLAGKKARTGTMLVQDYIRPAAIRAGILVEKEGELFSKEGDPLSRFGFHNLGRHSLASFLMDEQANPAVVQAIMRRSQMDMTLYYAHSSKEQTACCARQLRSTHRASANIAGTIAGTSVSVDDRGQSSELWCYHELTVDLSGSSSAVERQLPNSSPFNTYNDLQGFRGLPST